MTGDDASESDSASAIDLSRRKGASSEAVGRPSLVVIRHSLVGARHAAAPYVTMARIALARVAVDRLARAGALVLALLAFTALFADVLAADLPIACRWRGAVYVMPALTQPPSLEGMSCTRMERERGAADWIVRPLVAFGPARSEEPAARLRAPGTAGHPLGTDALGRDVFARIVYGTRTALGLGLAASFVLVALGTSLGALAGFAGGIVDALVARAVESLASIPTLVLVFVVAGLVPHPTTATLLWTIALTRWPELARLVRAEVLVALGSDYVTAARALGASSPRVLWRHVLPNAMGPVIVAAAFAIASVVLVEATVDFLHVGPSDVGASWGEMMGEARVHEPAWWLVAFPGAVLLATLSALYLVGEAARNALDPRLRGLELVD
jgi:peptide/nickel transport system permease protein